MLPHRNKNSWCLITACTLLLGTCLPALAQTSATLYLKNGAVLSGEVKTIGPESLAVALAGASTALSQNYATIARIEWPEPDLWNEAMAAFDSGMPKEALELFTALSTAPASVSFYPAPGNFAERARRMMLQCHRRLRDGAAITKLARSIDWSKLPEAERTVSPVLKVWGHVGVADWTAAKAAADEAARVLGAEDSDRLELSFLRARIGANLGLMDEAIAEYAVCYTLPSSDPGLAADALRESAVLLVAKPDRKDELRALVHLYATNIGRGKLWKDAPAEVAALLKEELSRPVEAPPPAQEKAAATGVAGGEFVTIAQFRFEPPPADAPKPAADPSKQPVKFEPSNGTFKGVDAPAGWDTAGTRVGLFTSGKKSNGTLTRELGEDDRMKLTKGKTLRLKMDLRFGAVYKGGTKAVRTSSYFRWGILNGQKAGYGVNMSLMADEKGIAIMGDTGGDGDLLGGQGVKKVPVEGSAESVVVAANKVLSCEFALQLQDENKVLVTARVGQITGSATLDAADGQPIVTDFTKSTFVLRMGRANTAVHFDNLVVEVSP